nr:MAG TPA: N-acetylmuramoyl-L-alanine amidase [Caudoviricetes sp.]
MIHPNYAVTDVCESPNYDPGRPLGGPVGIVIHWWGLPEWNQTHDQVVGFLCDGNRSNPTSAHYVVSDGRVTQLVSDANRAWHCAGNNARTIGIECHPAATEGDLRTVARLIAAIRSEWGPLPLSRHCDHFATACPGNYKDKLETLEYLSTHEGVEDMQLSDQVTRPDGHTASVGDILAYLDMRIERIESVLIGGQDKKGEDGKPTGARTNVFDEAAWNATNFARVYAGIDALNKRVDQLVKLIEIGAN